MKGHLDGLNLFCFFLNVHVQMFLFLISRGFKLDSVGSLHCTDKVYRKKPVCMTWFKH